MNAPEASPSSSPEPMPPHLSSRHAPVRARWIGLQNKLLLSNLLLITALLIFCGVGFAWHSAAQARVLADREQLHLGRLLATTARSALARGDAERLSDLARETLRSTSLASIAFYTEQGQPLVAWQADAVDQARRFEIPAIDTQSLGQRVADDLVLPVLASGSPDAATVGFVAVSRSHAPTTALLRRSLELIASWELVLLGLSLPLVFLIIQRALRPIRQLAVAARNVAAGRFETVDIVRGDALGVLAETFNHMVRRLAEQKQRADEAHARLLEANLHLEQKIAERTSAIEAASQRLASEIAEKEDFLRAVGHDLNAPLRNIDGMVTLLLRKHGEELPEEMVNKLHRIKKNVEHETSLINDLLELSRIKTRREQPEPVNLEELMWELRGLFENDLRERGIDLVIESRLPTVHAERARVRQVFQNLIDNAIKYMGEGARRHIAVGARLGRSETEFWVRDTGQGIAADDMGRIFYVFRRGRNQGGVAGKGVGLASVKSIVENYNGRIWVESEVGRGSTFRFTMNGRFVAQEGDTVSEAPPRRREEGKTGTRAA